MFRQPAYSRAITTDIAQIERRLQALERRLERAGTRVSANASQALDSVSDVIAGALSDVAERFRGGAGSATDQAWKLGGEVASFGNDAVRRMGAEARQHPLATVAIVAGVGILLGLSLRRS